ncbi:hypothetical protein K439DRAFT_1511992 [Ramaria rubella]|nr:hypothetical protein K439DRAFT_1511992 [Ramaria rubella]
MPRPRLINTDDLPLPQGWWSRKVVFSLYILAELVYFLHIAYLVITTYVVLHWMAVGFLTVIQDTVGPVCYFYDSESPISSESPINPHISRLYETVDGRPDDALLSLEVRSIDMVVKDIVPFIRTSQLNLQENLAESITQSGQRAHLSDGMLQALDTKTQNVLHQQVFPIPFELVAYRSN